MKKLNLKTLGLQKTIRQEMKNAVGGWKFFGWGDCYSGEDDCFGNPVYYKDYYFFGVRIYSERWVAVCY